MIDICLILGILSFPITKNFFGLFALDSIILLFYSCLIYLLNIETPINILAINLVHCILRSMFFPNALSNVCVFLATMITMILFILYAKGNSQELNHKTLRNACLFILGICDTLVVIFFAIIGYFLFELPKAIFIGSVIVAPISGFLLAYSLYWTFLMLISLNKKQFLRFTKRLALLK